MKRKVCICIATFRRPQGLQRLLASIDRQVFDGDPPDIRVIVVDNDSASSLKAKGEPVEAWCKYPLTYLVETRRGVAAVRNRALDAVDADADFIAFIDDDEEASPQWLAELMRIQAATGAAVVQGPVLPRYETPPPPWIEVGKYFELGPYADGEKLEFAGTNNSFVAWPAISRQGLQFDLRFNLTGGEDQDFFDRLRVDGGGMIVAAAKAAVLDDVPGSRLTAAWVLKRWFRLGNTLGRIALIRRRNRLLRFGKGLARLARGIVRALTGLVSSRTELMNGLADAAWGAGTLFAYLALRYDEYGDEAYRHEPQGPERAKG